MNHKTDLEIFVDFLERIDAEIEKQYLFEGGRRTHQLIIWDENVTAFTPEGKFVNKEDVQ